MTIIKNKDANLNSSFYSYSYNSLFWHQAWYRRGKANVSLGNNRDAICDLNIAKSVESSTGGKKQIESEVKIILDQSTSANISVKPRQKESSLNKVGKKLSLLNNWQIGQGFFECTFVIVIAFEVCLKSKVLHFEFIIFPLLDSVLSFSLLMFSPFLTKRYVHNQSLIMLKTRNALQFWKQYVDVRHA